MRGRPLGKSARAPSGDWPATPPASAVSGESATVRVQLAKGRAPMPACPPRPGRKTKTKTKTTPTTRPEKKKTARYVLIQSDPPGRRMSRLSFLYTPWAGEPGATPPGRTAPTPGKRAEEHRPASEWL